MFEGCRAKKQLHLALSAKTNKSQDEIVQAGSCDVGMIPLLNFSMASTQPQVNCCKATEQFCSGCASASINGCGTCAGGFLKKKDSTVCTACMDLAGWLSKDAKTCKQISNCSNEKFHGVSSNDACCKCGGGVDTVTPFEYEDRVFVIGEDINLMPMPRTAQKYGLSEDCNLANKNMTMDGATGVISYLPRSTKPTEAVILKCLVTAYQTDTKKYTTEVRIIVEPISFGNALLVFTSTSTSYTMRKMSGTWTSLTLNCAPAAPWLAMQGSDLRLTSPTAGVGVVDNVQDAYEGQKASLCIVSGNVTDSPNKSTAHVTKFIVLQPTVLDTLKYPSQVLVSSTSERTPAIDIEAPKHVVLPTSYVATCDKADFSYDELHGIGYYQGHSFLEVDPSGQILMAISSTFSRVFDAMEESNAGGALNVTLSCRIFGRFRDRMMPPISTDLKLIVTDPTCWVQKVLMGKTVQLVSSSGQLATSTASCRYTCRKRSSCSHYVWLNNTCFSFTKQVSGLAFTVYSKITNCAPSSTCVFLNSSNWYQKGKYCPVGQDIIRDCMTYLKDGLTAKETLYLHKFKTAMDQAETGCRDGLLMMQRKHPSDFQDLSKGYFEFQGLSAGCIDPSLVEFVPPMSCKPPVNVTAVTKEEMFVGSMVLDDPATTDSADFWLDPCDCVPQAWGKEVPVDPLVFEGLPPINKSQVWNFVPPPLEIVQGEFTCPAREMLGAPLYESSGQAMSQANCETKCKQEPGCDFYFHGLQNDAQSCRLYFQCSSLVREAGLSGVLVGLPLTPLCLVANPEQCWTSSMRKHALIYDNVPAGFTYWNLHAQCDFALLLGGYGVIACKRPSYRTATSHAWAHKRPLPAEFDHGVAVVVSCWMERYVGLSQSQRSDLETLTCVNGQWFNSRDAEGLGDFRCHSCVQVAQTGYSAYESKRQQELYFFNKLVFDMYSEVNSIGEGVYCMVKSNKSNEMAILPSSKPSCPTKYRIDIKDQSGSNRYVKISGTDSCMALRTRKEDNRDSVFLEQCNSTQAAQLIPTSEISNLFTRLHSNTLPEIDTHHGLLGEFLFSSPNTQVCTTGHRFTFPDFRKADDKISDPMLHYADSGWTVVEKYKSKSFSARWTGFLVIKKPGNYIFYVDVNRDEVAKLMLNGSFVIDTCEKRTGMQNDGYSDKTHAVKSAITPLPAGQLPLTMNYMETGKGDTSKLILYYQGPDTGNEILFVPSSSLLFDIQSSERESLSLYGCAKNTAMGALSGGLFRASTARSGQTQVSQTGVQCRFAPILSKQDPVQLETTQDFLSDSWNSWNTDLERLDIKCQAGHVLTIIDVISSSPPKGTTNFKYTCASVAGLGACTPMWTDHKAVTQWGDNNVMKITLGRLRVECPGTSLLASLKFEFSDSGKWTRFKSTCCKTGGAPSVMARWALEDIQKSEGMYCPTAVGSSGRLDYVQKKYGGIDGADVLSFDADKGKWCIGKEKCSLEESPQVEPFGVVLPGLDITCVSDFDGDFAGHGVSGGSQRAKKFAVTNLPKPPRRSNLKPPTKPTLEVFNAEMPRYSDKCIGYGDDLWKKIHETITDKSDEQVQQTKPFETENEEAASYTDTHPCQIYKETEFVEGKFGGGSGRVKEAGQKLGYEELASCSERDSQRGMVAARMAIASEHFASASDLAHAIVTVNCNAMPGTLVAPFGLGIDIENSKFCLGITDLAKATLDMTRTSVTSGITAAMAEESDNDCDSLQTSFARLFCDIHCVRDAVVRGDRSILRNMKTATDITNRNMEQLSSWIVDTARIDTDQLGQKMESAITDNSKSFQDIKKLLPGAAAKPAKLLQAAKDVTKKLQKELEGFAETASFNTVSKVSARGALEDFAASESARLEGPANVSKAISAISTLASLHAKLKGASDSSDSRSKTDYVAMRVEKDARHMQDMLRINIQTLGMYRHYSNMSHGIVKSIQAQEGRSDRHARLVELDRVWWKFRAQLDDYLDSAEEEINGFREALASMSDYEHCSVGYKSVLSTYKRTMATTDKAHTKLKSTWRHSQNLFGELASIIVDGEIFDAFLQHEGCASSLMDQTSQQARLAANGLNMLLHRFKVSGLREPNTVVVTTAAERIQESLKSAREEHDCK